MQVCRPPCWLAITVMDRMCDRAVRHVGLLVAVQAAPTLSLVLQAPNQRPSGSRSNRIDSMSNMAYQQYACVRCMIIIMIIWL